MAKDVWKNWKNLTSLERSAIENIKIAKSLILKNVPKFEIVSIYLKGSFIRREMNEESDLDIFVVVKSAKSLGFLKKLRNIKTFNKPRPQIGGHCLWELKTGKKLKSRDGKLKGSPTRAAIHLPFFKLIYGREIEPNELNFGDDKKRLNGMIRLIKDTLLPMYERGEWDFSNIIKPVFWLVENSERAKGKVPPHSWKNLAKSIKDKDHIIHKTLDLRLHPTKDKRIRKEYIKELKKYIELLEKESVYGEEKLNFAIFTDVHYDPRKIKNTSKGIKGEESVKNFLKLIEILKKGKQDFVVNLGDLVEAEPKKSFPIILKSIKKISSPVFHVIGNHELEVLSIKELKSVLKLKKFYYSKEIKGYKLIFLNAFDKKTSKPDHRRKSRIIGGNISNKQIKWLKKELKSTKGKAIIFTHKLLSNQELKNNPIWAIAPERYTKVENASVIRKILENSKKVLAVFQGHVHQNFMVKIKNIPYFTIQGFCQNKNYSQKQKASKSFAIVSINNGSLIVEIKGDKANYKHNFSKV